jgi:hypothetical protein
LLLITGSRGFAHEQDPAKFRKAKSSMEAALRVVESRLMVLERDATLQRRIAQNDSLRSTSPSVLRARHDVIRTRLQSLETAPAAEQRGALPGLRAALADLEHRTDIAQLAAADSATELDATVSAWLAEVGSQLDRAESAGERAAVVTRRDALAESRRTHTVLCDRFDALRSESAGDVRAKRALGRELAGLRRDVRALVRSIGPGQSLVMS